MHTLVSFLGRNLYHKTRYLLPDGSSEEAAYVGYGLRRALQVDRMVILGTAGSMWDHLFERDVDLQSRGEDLRLELAAAVEEEKVTQQQLDQLAPLLEEQLDCTVGLRIIPEALEPRQQVELLQALAEASDGAQRLSLDVTHGFRHLPMLILMAALYLRSTRPELRIEGIWYGAFRPGSKMTEVIDLGGILEIADWLDALRRHDWLGDYGAVADLIDDEETGELLRQAAFNESIHQGQQARKRLQRCRERLRERPLSGPGALFQPLLEERIAWVDRQQLYQRQREQALSALQRGDFLRASLYGFEAFITRLVRSTAPGADPDKWSVREKAKEDYEKHKPRESYRWYELLRNTRNVLAHGTRPQEKEIQRALASPQQLRALLEECFGKLLPEDDA